jgi:hypothetical protein
VICTNQGNASTAHAFPGVRKGWRSTTVALVPVHSHTWMTFAVLRRLQKGFLKQHWCRGRNPC